MKNTVITEQLKMFKTRKNVKNKNSPTTFVVIRNLGRDSVSGW